MARRVSDDGAAEGPTIREFQWFAPKKGGTP